MQAQRLIFSAFAIALTLDRVLARACARVSVQVAVRLLRLPQGTVGAARWPRAPNRQGERDC